uniref:Putative secreted protein n=1 Tax=Anopheles darlingi TaxID=43151 RepID=A0A2M4DHP5_ANODA
MLRCPWYVLLPWELWFPMSMAHVDSFTRYQTTSILLFSCLSTKYSNRCLRSGDPWRMAGCATNIVTTQPMQSRLQLTNSSWNR